MRTSPLPCHPPRREQGVALLIILTIIGLGAAFMLVSALNKANSQIGRDKVTAAALAQAKDALIGYAVANMVTPGGLPFPDRNNDGNYDGSGDCVPSGFNPALHLLGQWPSYQEQGCGAPVSAFGLPLTDSRGEALWYAVSGNLVKSAAGTYPLIHTNITANWFTVVNEQGVVLTNRAAVVILAPGGVVQTQSRGGAAPGANQFLESAIIGGITYTNFAIEAGDTGFISRSADDTFNDRLFYITTDELMTSLTKRVAQELKQLLDASGTYPSTIAGLPGLPNWFTTNWLPVANYSQVNANQATLNFNGCGITYTLNLGAASTQSQRGC